MSAKSNAHKKRYTILIAIAALILYVFVINIKNLHLLTSKMSYSADVPAGYMEIYKPEIKKYLKLDIAYNCKGKNPTARFLYKNKYLLFQYKIPQSNQVSFHNIMEEPKNEDVSNLGQYSSIKEPNFTLHWSFDSVCATDSIHLYYFCQKIVDSIRNDTLIYLSYCGLNYFAFSYASGGIIDMKFRTGRNSQKDLLDVVFLKKQNDVFMVAMAPIHDEIMLQEDRLFNIIN